MKKNQTDYSEEIYLMDSNEDYEPTFKTSYKEKLTNLIQQIKMKDNQLEKASNQIQLLTVDLEVTKKSYEESLRELKDKYNKKIEKYKIEELKFQEKIRELEKRNTFLEYEVKRRVEQPANDKKQLKLSNRKSSIKSILRESHSEQRKLDWSRNNKSVKEVTPRKEREFLTSENKYASLQNKYLKKVIEQIQIQDQLKDRYLQELVQKDLNFLEVQKSKIDFTNSQLKEAIEDQKNQSRIMIKSQQTMKTEFLQIIKQQNNIIEKLKQKNYELVMEVQEFIEKINSIKKQKIELNYGNFEKILTIINKALKQKYLRKQKEMEEVKNSKINNYVTEINIISKMYVEIKKLFGFDINNNHEDLVSEVKRVKTRKEWLQAQRQQLQKQNDELIELVEAFIVYSKKSGSKHN